MICLRCAAENGPLNRFCVHCGTQMGHSCLSCGFENPVESRFCGGCAARLQEVRADDHHGERRQLTVLFCDVVGSTELSQLLDPEDLRELIAVYQEICGHAVLAHQGHVAQYLGDGVVVYFGYPQSHEDEAQRAVRCGLDILEGVRALHASGRFAEQTSLDVRLGAHTGRVVVGPVGAGDRKERIALGDTPNIAARIQCHAGAGTLTVSDATWRIVEGYVTGECLGEFELKGVSKPMRLWLITGVSGSRERIEVASRLTPFVGRERERSILSEAWVDCQTGRSHFVLLRGEAGMGKSRLAQRFRDEVQFLATRVLFMRATPYSSNSPFQPAIELLEHLLVLERTAPPQDRLDHLEEGLRALGLAEPEAVVLFASLLSIPVDHRYAPLPISPARRHCRTLELFVELVAAVARTGPTLLLVEDLHWSDSSTVEMLELLVSTTPEVPLLGVFTARPEFELNAHWTTPITLRAIDLPKFERTEAETVVRGVALGKPVPSDVLRRILARSDGVPLFVEELTHSVLDSGMLKERAACWEAVGPVSPETIPATMDASLTARIDRLGASRATAQLAATIGRRFGLALLREVSERDEATLTRDLEHLVQAGLAWSVDDEADTYEFKHALVRDAAYNSLLRSARQSHHGRIARALRGRFAGQVASRPDLVAQHLTEAGEHEEAIPFWQAAGHQALARAAVLGAAGHFERAIDCLGRLPSTPERQESELELQILIVPLLMSVYGWGSIEVERACGRGLALAEELQRDDASYTLVWGLWSYSFLRGEMASALDLAERVLGMAQGSGSSMIQLTGHHAIAYTLVYRGEFQRALTEADAGLRLYDFEQERELANTFSVSSAVSLLASRGHALWMTGRVAEADDCWAEMIQLARDLQHPFSLASALGFALHGGGVRFSYPGQMDRLLGFADELIELSREADFFFWYADACWYRGIIAEAMGDAQRARSQMQEGRELFAQTGSQLSLVMMNVICAETFHRLGDEEEARLLLDAAEAEMIARQEGLMAPEIWRVRGRLLAGHGDRCAAEAAYRHAIERAQGQRAVSLELRAALDLHDLYADIGRGEEGRVLLAGLVHRFTQGRDRPELARARAIVNAPSCRPVITAGG
jgi:class 3 adenylate cyclase/tetratricopeptide (TPR) repeat protein